MEDKLILIDDIPEEERGGPTSDWIKKLFIKYATYATLNLNLKRRER